MAEEMVAFGPPKVQHVITDNSGGSSNSAIIDGADSSIKATVKDLADANPLTVAIVDASGDQITSFGGSGGTQYTEDAAAAANPVGTAVNLVRDDARGGGLTTTDGDNVAARGTNAGELYVKHVDAIPVTDNGGILTVDGTVTANLSATDNAVLDNIDTSTAAAATSLAIMDDWDETDRAKVNPIAGQAGVQGASGVVTALTQRVVLATDVALPAGTNAIGKLAANSGVDIGDVDVTSIAAGDNNIGNVDIVTMPDATVVGKAAHDAVVSGNPVLLAGYASAAAPTDVSADGDVARIWTTLKGAVNVADGGGTISVDDGAGALTVDNGGTFVVQENGAALTSLQLIDNFISGSRGLVTEDNSAAIKTSTELVDDVVYTSGDALSKTAGIAAQFDDTSPGAVTENKMGPLRMSSRREMYVTLRDAAGNERGLNVDANGAIAITAASIPSHAVTNAGTFAVQVDGAALTSLQLIDDTVFTDDTSTHATGTTKGQGIMAVANPTDAAVDANDIGMVAMTLARALKNDITTIAGTAPTTAGFIDIKGADGNVFVRQATASNLNMTEASASSALTSLQLIDDVVYTDDTSTHATGTSKGVGIMATATPTDTSVNANDIGMVAMTTDRRLLVDASGVAVPVTDNSGSLTVDYATTGSGTATGALRVELANNGTGLVGLNAGTNAIGKLAANSGVDIGDVDVTSINGFPAQDAAVAGNPLLTGGRASAATPTAMSTDGDSVYLWLDKSGATVTTGYVAQDAAVAGNPLLTGGRASAAEPSAMSADGDSVYNWLDKKGRQIVAMQTGTGTQTSVASSATNVTLLAANTSRKGASLYNDSTQVCYVRMAATATSANFSVKMQPDDYFEVPFGYSGIMDGIWASANGNMRVTEYT